MTALYTRDTFDRRRAAIKQLEGRETRTLAFVAVPLGFAQLVFIRWAEGALGRATAVPIEGAIFIAYMLLVGALIWRMVRRLRAVRLSCPQCGRVLEGMSERVAAATGKCDTCGGQVIQP